MVTIDGLSGNPLRASPPRTRPSEITLGRPPSPPARQRFATALHAGAGVTRMTRIARSEPHAEGLGESGGPGRVGRSAMWGRVERKSLVLSPWCLVKAPKTSSDGMIRQATRGFAGG